MPDAIDRKQQQTRADTYRWPQKVKRYGLEAHPFLRLFVGLYENMVPWNLHPKGWDAEGLNAYICERLLPGLKPTDCTGPSDDPFGGKYYLQSIALEAALQADEHAELVALRARLGEDPEGVRKDVLRFFNNRKQVRFTEWWDFMNQRYSHEPAWMYCVLKSVFDDCGRGVRRAPDRVEEKVLEKMTAAVAEGALVPGVGLASQYVIDRMGLLCGTNRYLREGWTRIPGISTNGPSDEGVRLLSFLGRKAGWCVASEGVGRSYLNSCDFFVMCRKDRPVVGARVGKDTLNEAAGYRNGRQNYARDIELLRRVVFRDQQWHNSSRWAGILNTDWQDAEWHEVLNRFPFGWDYAPEHLRKDSGLRQQVIASLVRQSAMDPFWARFIPGEFSERPEFLEAEKKAWLQHLDAMPLDFLKVPQKLWSDPEIVKALESCWELYAASRALEMEEIPEHILRGDAFKVHWAHGWEVALRGAPMAWTVVPRLLQEFPSVREAWIAGWEKAVRNNPEQGFPEELRDVRVVRDSWVRGWLWVLRGRNGRWNHIPEELREQPDIMEAVVDCLAVQLRCSPKHWCHVPVELRDAPALREARVHGWEAEVLRCPEKLGLVPEELMERLRSFPRIRSHWLQRVLLEPTNPSDVPGVLWNDPEIVKSLETGWANYVSSRGVDAREIPACIQRQDAFRQPWVQGWVNELLWFPDKLARVPEPLREMPAVNEAAIEGWLKALHGAPEKWGLVPAGFRAIPKLREAVAAGWEVALRRNPESWSLVPEGLKEMPRFREALMRSWEAVLYERPESWRHVPRELSAMPNLRAARLNGWQAALQHTPERCREVSSELLEDPTLLAMVRAFLLEQLVKNPLQPVSLPKVLLSDPEIARVREEGWKKHAASRALETDEVPDVLRAVSSFTPSWAQGWERELLRRPSAWGRVPRELKHLSNLSTALADGWAAVLEQSPQKWGELPDELRDMPRFREEWKRCWTRCLQHTPKVFLPAPEFVCKDRGLFEKWESEVRSAFVEGQRGSERLLLDGWTRYASLNPVSLDQVVESVATEPSFVHAWREGWLLRLNAPWIRKCLGNLREKGLVDKMLEVWAKLSVPELTAVRSVIPDGVREGLALMAHDRLRRNLLTHPGVAVLRWLEDNPWRFEDLPQGQKDHPYVWSSCRNGWVKHLALFPVFSEVLPAAFLSDEKIKAALKRSAAAKQVFEGGRQAEERARLFEATVAKPAISDENVPAVFAENADLRKARLRYWRRIVAESPMEFALVPRSLREDAKLLSNFREALGPQIRRNPRVWETLPEAIRADQCLQRVYRIATRTPGAPNPWGCYSAGCLILNAARRTDTSELLIQVRPSPQKTPQLPILKGSVNGDVSVGRC